ncbi:flagellar basal body P-ring formation chaperone FlgA [Geminicoccaceae bacterium 1502E]|nr:flagellar basal body P-ring formation chaperone FlgA [Geminicoccaceae bacterium 1502E]
MLVQLPLHAAAAAGEPLRLASGEALRADNVQMLLTPALPAPTAGRRLEARVTTPRLPLVNSASRPVALRLVTLHREGFRFTATVEVEVEDGPVNQLLLTGEIRAAVAVPVAARSLPAGHVLGERDLEPGWLDESLLAEDTVLNRQEVAGRETLRRLSPGRPLRQTDLRAPRLVRRGEPVAIRFASAGLQITGRGIAAADAALGETVEVVNADSARPVSARVTGPSSVEALLDPARVLPSAAPGHALRRRP